MSMCILTLSCPSGGRLSTSPRSAWACWTACMLLFMVPISACWARLWWHAHGTRDRVMHTPYYLTFKSNVGVWRYRCANTVSASHQWGHVSSVHLPHSDLLLRSRHGAHVKSVRPANGARAHDAGECHWSVFHSAHAVKLLLQDSRPATHACIMLPDMHILMHKIYWT